MSYNDNSYHVKKNHNLKGNYDQLHNGKDREENSPRTYNKKTKVHNKIFDIYIPEYELDKERQRQKRAIDRQRPKNRKYMLEY